MPKREKTIRARLYEPEPGEKITYHSGLTLKGADTWCVARARKLYDDGLIELVQKRNSVGEFDYVAYVRRRPISRPAEHTFRYHEMSYAEKFLRSTPQ